MGTFNFKWVPPNEACIGKSSLKPIATPRQVFQDQKWLLRNKSHFKFHTKQLVLQNE